MLVTVALRRQSDQFHLTGVNVTPLVGDLEKINAFTFAGKSPNHFLFLAAMFLIFAFTIATLIYVTQMRKQLKRPIIWGIVVLVGIGTISLNWTTADIKISAVSIGLPCANFFSAGRLAPWILTLYLPVGAIAFWLLRWQGMLKTRSNNADISRSQPEPQS
jgi:hypothetical protein